MSERFHQNLRLGLYVAAEAEGVREGASCDDRLGVPLIEHAGEVCCGHLGKASRFAEKVW